MARFKPGDKVELLRRSPCGAAGLVGRVVEVDEGWFSTAYQVEVTDWLSTCRCRVAEEDLKKVRTGRFD